MLGLGTSATSIDSGQVYKELSELENYADLDVHFDFSTLVGDQGDAVAAADNFGAAGSGRNITSKGGTPTLDVGVMGRHSVSFDGGNDALVMASSLATSGKPMTMFIVAQGTNISGGGNDYILANAGDDEDISHLRIKSGTAIQTLWAASHSSVSTALNSTANSTNDYTIPDAKNFALVVRRDSSGILYVYADRQYYVGKKSNTDCNTPANFTLGAIGGTSETSADFDGYIGEVGLYDVDIGITNIEILLDELCTKWRIS
jgi:hypothetical protein